MKRPKVVIARDRKEAGGGIYNYYSAIAPYLKMRTRFVDVGRSHSCFGNGPGFWGRRTPFRLAGDWAAFAWAIARERPDFVHINPGLDAATRRALRRDAINALIARSFGLRVLVFWRGWDQNCCGRGEFPGGNRGWLARAFRGACAHIVLAERFRDDLIRWGVRVPIYVETTIAEDGCMRGSPYESGENVRRTDLLFLSRVIERKGVFELVDAFRLLKERNPAYTLTIAGDGPDLSVARGYVETLGLKDVSFPGYVTGNSKADCYRRASMFCFLSTHDEGLPNAVLEAMGMGLPVISSDVAGLRDILEDGKSGFIVRPFPNGSPRRRFDVREVAARIAELGRDGDLHRQVSLHNARYARERFGAATVAKRLEAIYWSVASMRKGEWGDR